MHQSSGIQDNQHDMSSEYNVILNNILNLTREVNSLRRFVELYEYLMPEPDLRINSDIGAILKQYGKIKSRSEERRRAERIMDEERKFDLQNSSDSSRSDINFKGLSVAELKVVFKVVFKQKFEVQRDRYRRKKSILQTISRKDEFREFLDKIKVERMRDIPESDKKILRENRAAMERGNAKN